MLLKFKKKKHVSYAGDNHAVQGPWAYGWLRCWAGSRLITARTEIESPNGYFFLRATPHTAAHTAREKAMAHSPSGSVAAAAAGEEEGAMVEAAAEDGGAESRITALLFGTYSPR